MGNGTIEELNTKQASLLMPDARIATKAFQAHQGEYFINFSAHGLGIGRIAEDPEVLTFTRVTDSSPTHVDAEIKVDEGISYNLAWSGISGGWPIETSIKYMDGSHKIYLGDINDKEAHGLPGGPLMVVADEGTRAGYEHDRLQRALVIGNKASSEFVIAKALREKTENPRAIRTSLGLLAAASLKGAGLDLSPQIGSAAHEFGYSIDNLREPFIEHGLLDLTESYVSRTGTFVSPMELANRAPVFEFDPEELTDELVSRISSSTDERAERSLRYQQEHTGPNGNFDRYVRTSVRNVLTNLVGIEPVRK